MKRIVHILVFILAIISADRLYAQRETMYAHYMFNILEINPAYAGSRNSLSLISLNRSHWTLVFDKAPITQSLNFHMPTDRDNVGVGFSFRSERYGPESTTSFYGDYSYRVNVTHDTYLRFGLKAGVSVYDVPLTQLIIDDPSDPAFASDIVSHWLPNFGFGLYYTSDNLFMGLSIPKMLEVNYFDNSLTAGVRTILQRRNYFFTAGWVFELNPDIKIIPTTYMRYQQDSPFEADITANLVLFDRMSAGVILRFQDAMGMMVGLWITENWSVNYSFDWAILNRVPSFNFGSHELVIRYDLNLLHSHRGRGGPPHF